MWRDHPFSQKNRTIERTVRVGDGGDREVCVYVGGGQNLKKGGSKYRRFFIELGHPSAKYVKSLEKFPPL